MKDLRFSLEQQIVIRARRSTVFRYFTDSERFAAWWGAGSRIDGRPGGEVFIRYPGGTSASGQVLEIVEGERIVFSYGYDDPSKPIPAGGSRVTITLRDVPQGTLLELRHDLGDDDTRNQHVGGWRFQLSLFANVAADEQHQGLPALLEDWFRAWAAPDAASCLQRLERCTTPDVLFRDRFACVSGRESLSQHIQAARQHMPGIVLESDGAPRACQGVALIDWQMRGPDGSSLARGSNVLELAPNSRIQSVTGIAR